MKWSELRTLPDSALRSEIEKLVEEQKNLRFQKAITPPENPQIARKTRRTIARIGTILRERAAGAAR